MIGYTSAFLPYYYVFYIFSFPPPHNYQTRSEASEAARRIQSTVTLHVTVTQSSVNWWRSFPVFWVKGSEVSPPPQRSSTAKVALAVVRIYLFFCILFLDRPSPTPRPQPKARPKWTRCKAKSTRWKWSWKTTSIRCWRGGTGWMIWLARPVTYKPPWVSVNGRAARVPYPRIYNLQLHLAITYCPTF